MSISSNPNPSQIEVQHQIHSTAPSRKRRSTSLDSSAELLPLSNQSSPCTPHSLSLHSHHTLLHHPKRWLVNLYLSLTHHLANSSTTLKLSLFIFFALATLSILSDSWTHSQITSLRSWVSPSPRSSARTTSWPALAMAYAGLPACDPFAEPGAVMFDDKFYHDANWIPFGSSCPPSPDYLSALRALRGVSRSRPTFERERLIHRPAGPGSDPADAQQGPSRASLDVWGRPYPDLNFLRGKTVLVLGDSVDRNALEHLKDLLGANVRSLSYHDINAPPPKDWDSRNTPWEVDLGLLHDRNVNASAAAGAEFAGLNCRFVNGFFYGLDDIDEFEAQGDWHAPGLAERRIEELFAPVSRQFAAEDGERPAFISIQSGMWDLAFFGRRNRRANTTTDTPLTAAQLDWWQTRFRSVVRTAKMVWPDVPIWIRTTHRVGDQFWAAHDFQSGLQHGIGEGFVNFFSDVRVHQIREMQLYVARLEKIPVFDFGKVWEGYQKYQDKVHPQKVPGGVLFNQALIHHIWMESIGRMNWDKSLRDKFGSLPHVL